MVFPQPCINKWDILIIYIYIYVYIGQHMRFWYFCCIARGVSSQIWMCIGTVKALTKLHTCAVSSQLWLLADTKYVLKFDVLAHNIFISLRHILEKN